MQCKFYDDVFPGACGAGRDEFERAFPKGVNDEGRLLSMVASRRPMLMVYLPGYMTTHARRAWSITVEDYTNSSKTNFSVLNEETQCNIVRAFLNNLKNGFFYNRKGERVYYTGPIFRGSK